MKDLNEYCKGDESFNFVFGLTNISMQSELRKSYPVLTNIICSLTTKHRKSAKLP